MRRITSLALLAILGALSTSSPVTPSDGYAAFSKDPASRGEPSPKIENLLKARLEGVEGVSSAA